MKKFLCAVLPVILLLAAAVPANAEITSITWAGEWSTSWGKMILTQDGINVEGTFEQGKGRLSGLISGDTLMGSWLIAPTYLPPENGGDFVLKMAEDGKSFDGNWTKGKEAQITGIVNGTRKQASTTTIPIAEGSDLNSGIPEAGVSSTDVNSQTMRIIVIQLNNPVMLVNGQKKDIDTVSTTKPVSINNRMLIPIRAVIESMGGTISWNGEAKKITITTTGNSIEMWLGKTDFFVNGEKKTAEVAPDIIGGRTMVPIRFVIDNIPGCSMDWDAATQSATIKY